MFWAKAILILGITVILTGCNNDTTNGTTTTASAGTGTITNPFSLTEGTTKVVNVMGFKNICGSTAPNPSCASFNQDYLTLKAPVLKTGTYKVEFTGVDPTTDLVVYIYLKKDPASSSLIYISTLDMMGNGGNEIVPQMLFTAGEEYYLFLQSWGGKSTISVTATFLF